MNDKIIFLGTPKLAADYLKGLVQAGFNVVGVITQEDKIRGRNNKVEESEVSKVSKELNLPLHKPNRLNKDYSFIEELKPDLLLTFAYGQILSDKVLSLSRLKPLNLHGSLLPKYRGAAPMQYSLLHGDSITGVTLMEMAHEMDTGDIYAQSSFEISSEDNYTSLNDKISKCALSLSIEYLPLYFKGELKGIPQDNNKATYTSKITKEMEHLSLDSCLTFINTVRALSFTPGGYILLNDEMIKIFKASFYSNDVTSEIGEIVLARKKDIIIQLKDGQVKLEILQRPGKKMMNAIDFNNGIRDLQGKVFH